MIGVCGFEKVLTELLDILFAVGAVLLEKLPINSFSYTMHNYWFSALLYLVAGCCKFKLTREKKSMKALLGDMLKQTFIVVVSVVLYAGLTNDDGWTADVYGACNVGVHYVLLVVLCYFYNKKWTWLEQNRRKEKE